MAQHKYAVFFPEHTGYLHVRPLGDTDDFNLIWSVADGKSYVRLKRSPWPRPNKGALPFTEVKFYREVKGVPKLIHYQSFQHLDAEENRREAFMSVSTIWSYCNAGNLLSFLGRNQYSETPDFNRFVPGLESPEALEIFVWHFFDQMLQVYINLHEAGVAHRNGWHYNVFLHFPDDEAKLPDVYLCEFEQTGPIDADSVEKELAAMFINLTFIMSRRNYDLDRRGQDCRVNSEEGLPDPKFSEDLLDCRRMLGQMCYTQLFGNFGVEKIDIPYPGVKCQLPGLLEGIDILKSLVARRTQLAKAKASPLPDLRPLRRDQKPWVPKLFDSRVDLLKDNLETGGPWRIARVDPDTLKVLAVEKTDFNLHHPDHDFFGDEAFSPNDRRLETGGDLAKDKKNILDLAAKQDQAKTDEVVHSMFTVDMVWDEPRLYPKTRRSGSGSASASASASKITSSTKTAKSKSKSKSKSKPKRPTIDDLNREGEDNGMGKDTNKSPKKSRSSTPHRQGKGAKSVDATRNPNADADADADANGNANAAAAARKRKTPPMARDTKTETETKTEKKTKTKTKTKIRTNTKTKTKSETSPAAEPRRRSKRLRGEAADDDALP